MPNEESAKKPATKAIAIAASAVLVAAALAATGILAYGQNGTNITSSDDNATGRVASNATESAANATGAAATNDTSNRDETFTASATANSECSPVITTDDGVAVDGASTLIAGVDEDKLNTMTASLNDTAAASVDELIAQACDAIRDGKSVTALGLLQSVRDIINESSETQAAGADDQAADDSGEVEDEDEPGDVDVGGDTGDTDNGSEDSG